MEYFINEINFIDIEKNSRANAIKLQTWKRFEITGIFTIKVEYINKIFMRTP